MAANKWMYAAALLAALGISTPAHAEVDLDGTAEHAVFEDALTFAQVNQGNKLSTILVVGFGKDRVEGIDLSSLSHHYARDAFDVISGLTWERVEAVAKARKEIRSYPVTQLVGVGPRGLAHIAAGTNYPEHGKETGMDQGAFLFPKFSPAMGPGGQVSAGPRVLLDYEAEVCARFDREIRSLADFDAARKGFFLCGDFSDRATLFREINLRNPYSGDGFPDAKSGADRFPTGPFLVVPRDWKAFVAKIKFKTLVDGQTRQDVSAADMLKDLRAIVQETLSASPDRSWSYAGGRVPMIRRRTIGTESAVLTGTGDGVVFQEPSPELIKELMAAKDRKQELQIIDRYVREEEGKQIYLQGGNLVRHTSNYLGWINTTVVSREP